MKRSQKLKLTEVKHGLLYVPEPRGLFPKPGERVVIVDADGEEFSTKMHSRQPRIDGLTRLHQKHKTRPGDTVTINVSPKSPGLVRVRFHSQGGIDVRIDREVVDVFRDASSVNKVLRALAPVIRRQWYDRRRTSRLTAAFSRRPAAAADAER